MTVLPKSAEIPESVFTATGVARVVVLLSPSWPWSLLPQAATVPSEYSARLWTAPDERAITVLPARMPVTGTGTLLLPKMEGLPSWL